MNLTKSKLKQMIEEECTAGECTPSTPSQEQQFPWGIKRSIVPRPHDSLPVPVYRFEDEKPKEEVTEEHLKQMIEEELEVIITEKAKSKSQQRFMGMVHKCQETGDCASEEVRKAAKSMKKKDAEDFASTKHKGLPEKKKESKRKKS